MAVAPDGTEYVVSGPSTDSSAPSAPVRVYASHDHGRTWKATVGDPVQVQPSADVDIVVTRTGRLVVVELDSAGLNLVVSYSDDGGRTWTASTGAARIADQDRPWLAVGPDDPATHEPRVYLLFHNAFSGNATENMYVETSSDGGASFGIPVALTVPGSAAFSDLQCGDTTGPSSVAVNPRTGRIYAFWVTRHG
ncbi:MAG TPA: sialidase family protein, partial [Solirubrobacteraceae bacterium]|nr:sialidase family protein [Solirubrobacteraceae bacterium]